MNEDMGFFWRDTEKMLEVKVRILGNASKSRSFTWRERFCACGLP